MSRLLTALALALLLTPATAFAGPTGEGVTLFVPASFGLSWQGGEAVYKYTRPSQGTTPDTPVTWTEDGRSAGLGTSLGAGARAQWHAFEVSASLQLSRMTVRSNVELCFGDNATACSSADIRTRTLAFALPIEAGWRVPYKGLGVRVLAGVWLWRLGRVRSKIEDTSDAFVFEGETRTFEGGWRAAWSLGAELPAKFFGHDFRLGTRWRTGRVPSQADNAPRIHLWTLDASWGIPNAWWQGKARR